MPIEPSIGKDNKGKDKNIKELIEVEDKDISSPLPSLLLLLLLLICFIILFYL